LAPTQKNADQLVREKVAGIVSVIENTVIDALLQVRHRVNTDNVIRQRIEDGLSELGCTDFATPYILVTGHRRESFGDGMLAICDALLQLSAQHPNINIVYAVHMNPQVKDVVNQHLSSRDNIILLPPQEYGAFIFLMDRCTFILSDSGGIQEEAPSLNKPVLVMRDTTERMEAVESGAVKLVGTNAHAIVNACNELLTDINTFNAMANAINPFGDGQSSKAIADLLHSIEP